MTARPRDNESEANANDESRGTWELPGNNHRPVESKPSSFAAKLTQQFRELVKALTQPKPNLQATSKTKRSGKDETGRAFRMAARKVTRCLSVPTLIVHAVDFACNTLDWLHMWQSNNTIDTAENFTTDHYEAFTEHDYHHPQL